MNRFGKWTTALMVVGAAVGTVSVAGAAVIQTRISLDDFKRALGVRSVGTLITQTPIAGIKFWINKNTGTVTFRGERNSSGNATDVHCASSVLTVLADPMINSAWPWRSDAAQRARVTLPDFMEPA